MRSSLQSILSIFCLLFQIGQWSMVAVPSKLISRSPIGVLNIRLKDLSSCRSFSLSLDAKRPGKSKKSSGKGFGPEKTIPKTSEQITNKVGDLQDTLDSTDGSTLDEYYRFKSIEEKQSLASKVMREQDITVDERTEAFLQSRGLSTKATGNQSVKISKGGKSSSTQVDDGSRPFGESVLKRFSPSMQGKIDNILITSTFVSLSFVVLCGIGISFGALRVVFPSITVSDELDQFATKFLDPSFTPALAVFFFFSITLGLFKFAQISSSQTVYKE